MTRRRIAGGCIAVMVAAALAVAPVDAQAKKKQAAPATHEHFHDQAGHAMLWGGGEPVPAPNAPPTLTELEQARIENINLLDALRRALLEADTCRGELAQPRAAAAALQVQQRLEALVDAIEQHHPGYAWSATTGAFTKRP